jgi:hypothetical protein
MKFYAARSGYSGIECWAVDQGLCSLEGEEEQGDGYFTMMREELFKADREGVVPKAGAGRSLIRAANDR